MNPYSHLVTDLAAHIADHSIGAWNPDGIYNDSDLGIYIGAIPDTAATGVGLIVYSDDRDRDDQSPEIRVQVRIRGDRDARPTGLCHATADTIFTLLHDKSSYTLNTNTHVLLSRRHLRAPEERDENGRTTRADSYTFTTNPGGSSW